MDKKQIEIFHYDKERYAKEKHKALLEAARDVRLTTSYLIERAMECVREERADDDVVANPALLMLQQRTNPETLDSVLLLLDSDDAAARQLGAMVLREFPGLDFAPYPYSLKVINHLEKLVESEPDEEVLIWVLAAIGWQCHPAGTDILLRFVGDKRAPVRRVVGNNLCMGFKEDEQMPAPVAEAFLTLAKDVDDDIRWSVFYDIADFPYLFKPYQDVFRQAAHSAMQDPFENVREQARRAFEALS